MSAEQDQRDSTTDTDVDEATDVRSAALSVVQVAWIAHDVGLDIDLDNIGAHVTELAAVSPATLGAAQKYCQRRSLHSLGWLVAAKRLDFLMRNDTITI